MARLSELGIDFDHWCFACGRANPIGLHLDYDVGRERAETRFIPRHEHSGYEGVVHGGIVTALLDETMGWAIFHEGIWGVTARINVAFRQPILVGTELVVTGTVVKRTHRAVEMHGEVRDTAGTLLADADATFLVMPEEQRRKLEKRYSRIDEAFAKVKAAVADEEVRTTSGSPARSELDERSRGGELQAARRAGRSERDKQEKELEHGRT